MYKKIEANSQIREKLVVDNREGKGEHGIELQTTVYKIPIGLHCTAQ